MKATSKVQIKNEFRRRLLTGTGAALLVGALDGCGVDELRNPGYVAARNSLELSFRERLRLLDPATCARIEASLAVIRQAHEDIRKALASDPESPVLEQLWQSTWHDEIDLYDNVVTGAGNHSSIRVLARSSHGWGSGDSRASPAISEPRSSWRQTQRSTANR